MNNDKEDCFFYLYSSCAKGSHCPYRHQEACRQNETLCRSWEATKTCADPRCTGRHSLYHLEKKRSQIDCYWEQHGGCKKQHCPFKHSSADGTSKTFTVDPGNDERAKSGSKGNETLANTPNSEIPIVTSTSKPNISSLKKSLNQSHVQSMGCPVAESSQQLGVKKVNLNSNNEGKYPKKAKQVEPVDFQVKSFEQIMREKKSKQTDLGEPAKATVIPIEGSMKQIPKSIARESITAFNGEQSARKEEKKMESAAIKNKSVHENIPVDSTDSLLDYLDKELEEMNQLLS